jgi:hypothetical protein
MKVIYVAGPFRDKNGRESSWDVVENVRIAEHLAAEVWCMGAACICPHLNTANFGYMLEADDFLRGDFEIIRRCDALLMCPEWRDSQGAVAEHTLATSLGMQIFYSLDTLRAWLEKDHMKLAVPVEGC